MTTRGDALWWLLKALACSGTVCFLAWLGFRLLTG